MTTLPGNYFLFPRLGFQNVYRESPLLLLQYVLYTYSMYCVVYSVQCTTMYVVYCNMYCSFAITTVIYCNQ